MKLEDNPTLNEKVEKDSELKEWLVDFVGKKTKPENGEVTVEMIIEVIADQFPEFLLAVAEENWVRGYRQAFVDIESGHDLVEKEMVKQELERKEKNE